MTYPNGQLQDMLRKEEQRVAKLITSGQVKTDIFRDSNSAGTEVSVVEAYGKIEDLEIRLSKTIRRFV